MECPTYCALRKAVSQASHKHIRDKPSCERSSRSLTRTNMKTGPNSRPNKIASLLYELEGQSTQYVQTSARQFEKLEISPLRPFHAHLQISMNKCRLQILDLEAKFELPARSLPTP